MRLALIGQSVFGAEVYSLLNRNGHKIVGVFTVPDKNGREDPLATAASKNDTKVFKFQRWRQKGKVLPEVLSQYEDIGADLNVLPFCTQFIPMEVINRPKHESIVYHPSLLPVHRGASAINWTLINGDKKAGFSIFYADDGLDTGPILLQRETDILPNDTLDSLYSRFMMPVGIKAMGEAVDMIKNGTAPKWVQPEVGATYEPHISAKPELAKINWNQSAMNLHNFIRGCDKIPGAWTEVSGVGKLTLYGSSLWHGSLPKKIKKEIQMDGVSKKCLVHNGGILIPGTDGNYLNVSQLSMPNGRMINARQYGEDSGQQEELVLTPDEEAVKSTVADIWKAILNLSAIEESTDFFKSGAGSMDVTRLVEEIREKCGGAELTTEEVYMGPSFEDFIRILILKTRSGGGGGVTIDFTPVKQFVNNMNIAYPNQLFIDGAFCDSESGRTYPTINPHDESVICEVAKGSEKDVNRAVAAAKAAFYEGDWGTMNARDRGNLIFKLADLMEKHKEELATIESIDSGAVYTLALKTHVGMSIDTWKYFAGCCDKIQGSTIPINHARPNRNLTITKREPLGVCGLVTPWNYPLMMLSWKMAACLAAGNVVVHKPAQVSPLTALKFAELSALAGIPPGVINIIPGSGTEVGNAIVKHSGVRKVGFTGSTPIGAQLMKDCAESNIKKVSLELGGKSPLILMGDCDLDKAVRMAMGAVFFNKGENCIAAGRIFVADSIHDEFIERVLTEVEKMKIGDPLDRGTAHGPQNHKAHFNKLLEFCDRGVKEGAKLEYGGGRHGQSGLYFQPTIFTDVTDDMWIAEEESFGPVMIVSKFVDGDVQGVLRRANDTEYGLASGVFSQDVNKVMRIAEGLDAGTVFINTYNKTDVAAPFGGFKQSGFGKDLGQEALNEYLKTKTITMEY